MEESVVSAIPVADTIVLVLTGVRVHNVAQHVEPILVSLINECFEFIRRSAATAGGKEVGDVVPE